MGERLEDAERLSLEDDLSRLRRVGRIARRAGFKDEDKDEVMGRNGGISHYPYPEPVRPGGSAYGSTDVFSADWRELLPEGDPDRPSDPSEFIDHNDPEYRAVLKLLMRVPIDRE